MMVVPKEKPVHSNLSTYFLDIEKFLEHCKREYGAGCITLNTPPSVHGVIYFDTDETLSAVAVGQGDKELTGKEAVDFLLQAVHEQVSQVSLYQVDENIVYAWAKLHENKPLEGEMAAAEASLEELIKKVSSQKLTGYIDVAIGDDAAILIFQDGQVAGGSYSWGDATLESDQMNFDLLIRKSAQQDGVFKIFGTMTSPEKLFDVTHNNERKIEKASSSIIATLEELLDIFERVVQADADVDVEFDMLLRNKFVEKANSYSFLDPFANEFHYADQRITFTGKASEQELATGITECVRELADELGILQILKHEIANWSTYLGKDIAEISNRFL